MRDLESITLGAAASLLGEDFACTRARVASGEIRVTHVTGPGWSRRVHVRRDDVLALVPGSSKKWMTPKEAAALLGLTHGGVLLLAHSGVVRSRKAPRGELARQRGRPLKWARILLDRAAVERRVVAKAEYKRRVARARELLADGAMSVATIASRTSLCTSTVYDLRNGGRRRSPKGKRVKS